jgi:hypothetical protein
MKISFVVRWRRIRDGARWLVPTPKYFCAVVKVSGIPITLATDSLLYRAITHAAGEFVGMSASGPGEVAVFTYGIRRRPPTRRAIHNAMSRLLLLEGDVGAF